MSNIIGQFDQRLNPLQHELADGLVFDARWLESRGISRQLRSYYVRKGWLQPLARSVYRRPPALGAAALETGALGSADLKWQQVLVSLQMVLHVPIILGGRTALEVQGLGHYVAADGPSVVELYASAPPPTWLDALQASARFRVHRAAALFATPLPAPLPTAPSALTALGLVNRPWGDRDFPLIMSTPERAILELLANVPRQETFHQADMLMEGLTGLSPRRLEAMLVDCKSVKAKRLFFVLAERHGHAWFKRLDPAKIDLGRGKRSLAGGGKLHPTYQISMPEGPDGDR